MLGCTRSGSTLTLFEAHASTRSRSWAVRVLRYQERPWFYARSCSTSPRRVVSTSFSRESATSSTSFARGRGRATSVCYTARVAPRLSYRNEGSDMLVRRVCVAQLARVSDAYGRVRNLRPRVLHRDVLEHVYTRESRSPCTKAPACRTAWPTCVYLNASR